MEVYLDPSHWSLLRTKSWELIEKQVMGANSMPSLGSLLRTKS